MFNMFYTKARLLVSKSPVCPVAFRKPHINTERFWVMKRTRNNPVTVLFSSFAEEMVIVS